MTEATLRVRVEGGSEVATVLANIERLVEASRRRTEGASRAGRQRQQREQSQATAAELVGYRTSARAAVASDDTITRSRLRALALQGVAEKKFTDAYVQAHQRATQVLEQETGKRIGLTDKERRRVENLALAMVANHERAERARTATTERESRKRAALVRTLEGAVTTGAQAAGAVHGAIQAPRMQMAEIQATLAAALGEGGATQRELGGPGGLQQRVMDFAEREGMDPERLARSLQASQQQFSSLSGATPAERQAALQRTLSAAQLANDTQSDPEQVMRLSGALGGLGSQDTINGVLRSAIGISRRGGVELGSLSSQNLSTIQTQMAAAVANLRRENPNATEGDAQRTMVEAFTETLATLEVLAPRGLQGKSAGTAVRQLGSALHDPRIQRALYTRLQGEFRGNHAQRTAALDTFFTQDANGQRVMRDEFLGAQGGTNFGRAITSLAGGDPDRIRALLGRGTREGDRGEVFHANQREELAALAGQDSRGRTGWDALAGMREGANDVNSADIDRTRAIVQGLDQTTLTRARVRGMRNARAPSTFQRWSDAASNWAAEHPLLSTLGGAVGVEGLLKGARGVRAMPGGGGAAGLLALGLGAGLVNTVAGATGTTMSGDRLGTLDRVNRITGTVNPFLNVGRAASDVAQKTGLAEQMIRLAPQSIQDLARALAANPPTVQPAAIEHAVARSTTQPRELP